MIGLRCRKKQTRKKVTHSCPNSVLLGPEMKEKGPHRLWEGNIRPVKASNTCYRNRLWLWATHVSSLRRVQAGHWLLECVQLSLWKDGNRPPAFNTQVPKSNSWGVLNGVLDERSVFSNLQSERTGQLQMNSKGHCCFPTEFPLTWHKISGWAISSVVKPGFQLRSVRLTAIVVWNIWDTFNYRTVLLWRRGSTGV